MLPSPAGREARPGVGAPLYVHHRPERTLLYQIVDEYYPAFKQHLESQEASLPGYVEQEFEDYLKCGRLEHGFLRVCCGSCHAEHLVAFSCKRRGFCPSCGAKRMAESAELLVDEVFPEQPVRQWVLSVPYPMRFLSASRPAIMGRVFGIDIATCPACGGAVQIIACIEDPVVIEKILTHLYAKTAEPEDPGRRLCRAPPRASLFD